MADADRFSRFAEIPANRFLGFRLVASAEDGVYAESARHGRSLMPVLVAAILAAALAPPLPAQEEPPAGVFEESLEVALRTFEVRVLDSRGDPVIGLGAADFRVEVGGAVVPVEAVDWVTSERPLAAEVPTGELAGAGIARQPAGQLVLFFFQADFEPSRLVGHLRMLQRAEDLAAALHPRDLAAVASYDSHLKLRCDFTHDRRRLVEAMAEAIRYGKEPEGPPQRRPSLAGHLDFDAARRAASPERALELVARAFAEIPGRKVLVYLGYGLGRWSPDGIRLPRDYQQARQALADADIPALVLDISDSDYHSLEVGLRALAEDTGGSYRKTHVFPDGAVRGVAGELAGRYLLTIRTPDLPAGRHRVKVRLDGARGRVIPAAFDIET
jgi:hypothetical protein